MSLRLDRSVSIGDLGIWATVIVGAFVLYGRFAVMETKVKDYGETIAKLVETSEKHGRLIARIEERTGSVRMSGQNFGPQPTDRNIDP